MSLYSCELYANEHHTGHVKDVAKVGCIRLVALLPFGCIGLNSPGSIARGYASSLPPLPNLCTGSSLSLRTLSSSR